MDELSEQQQQQAFMFSLKQALDGHMPRHVDTFLQRATLESRALDADGFSFIGGRLQQAGLKARIKSKVTLPDGRVKPGVEVSAKNFEGTEVGWIEAEKMRDGSLQVYHSKLEDDLQKKGIGSALYRELISTAKEKGYTKITSDDSVSKEAAAVWEKLGAERTKSKVKEFDGQLQPVDNKPLYTLNKNVIDVIAEQDASTGSAKNAIDMENVMNESGLEYKMPDMSDDISYSLLLDDRQINDVIEKIDVATDSKVAKEIADTEAEKFKEDYPDVYENNTELINMADEGVEEAIENAKVLKALAVCTTRRS